MYIRAPSCSRHPIEHPYLLYAPFIPFSLHISLLSCIFMLLLLCPLLTLKSKLCFPLLTPHLILSLVTPHLTFMTLTDEFCLSQGLPSALPISFLYSFPFVTHSPDAVTKCSIFVATAPLSSPILCYDHSLTTTKTLQKSQKSTYKSYPFCLMLKYDIYRPKGK